MNDFRVMLVQIDKNHEIATFTSAGKFMDFVRQHVAEFDSNVKVYGDSNRTVQTCDNFIEAEMAKVSVL